MNSSISSSNQGWGRFATMLVAVAAILMVLIVGIAYAADPYDTGRSTLLGKPGLRPQGPWTAAASRGRDQAFDAAILGNSHIQLLSPERLKASTGLSFVQLATPGSGPDEQFTILDWFLLHRTRPAKALVLGADLLWCTDHPTPAADQPFPYWIYSRNPLEYVRGLASYGAIEETGRRIVYAFDTRSERARPDGYWDYEPMLIEAHAKNPSLGQLLEARSASDEASSPADSSRAKRRFSAADELRAFVTELPAETALIVVFPPRYINSQPRPGTEAAHSDGACKEAIASAVGTHPKSAVLDWRVERAENRNPAWFFDMGHYREPLARLIERDIDMALAAMRVGREPAR